VPTLLEYTNHYILNASNYAVEQLNFLLGLPELRKHLAAQLYDAIVTPFFLMKCFHYIIRLMRSIPYDDQHK
jgi:hypothetical protein